MHTVTKPNLTEMAADMAAITSEALFGVSGIVAVITGGGTGTRPEVHGRYW